MKEKNIEQESWEQKVPMWQKVTACLNIFMLLGQLMLPTIGWAITNEQVAAELSNPQYTRSYVNDGYLYKKSDYVEDKVNTSTTQNIGTFFKRLKDNYKVALQPPVMIPIQVRGLTVIIPHYPLQEMVGDNFVQSRFIRSQIYNELNRNLLIGYNSESNQINDLYNKAYEFSKTGAAKFGDAISQSQIDKFGKNFIWPESRTIGSVNVLVPVVHLTSNTIKAQEVNGHQVEFHGESNEFKSINVDTANLYTYRNALIRSVENITVTDGSIIADGDLNLLAGGTVANLSSHFSASKNVKIFANNYVQKTLVHRYETPYSQGTRLGKIAKLEGNNIYIKTSNDIVLEGAQISGNNIALNAGNNIIIKSAKETYAGSQTRPGYSENTQTVEHLVSRLTAEDSIKLLAGGVVELHAAKLHADKGVIQILANNGVYIANEFNEYQRDMNRKWGKTTETEQEFETIAIRSALDAGKGVLIASQYGDITLKATEITSTDGTHIDARNGRVNLLMAKQQDHYFYHKIRKGTWKIKTETIQDTEDTAVYNEIVGGVKINATHGITIEFGQQEGQSVSNIVNGFASSKSLSWMSDLYNDPEYACPPQSLTSAPRNINPYAFEAIKADPEFKQCNSMLDVVYTKLERIKKHETTSALSPAAMAVIAIAVSVAMGPAGAGITGSNGAIATAVGKGTFSAAALSAGAATLTTQAAVSLANGEGIDGAIKSITESDNLRSLAISMVTAGVMQELDGLDFFEYDPNAPLMSTDTLISLGNQSLQVVIESAAKAGIETAISGGSIDDLSDSFVNALKASAVSALGETLTANIESTSLSTAAKYIAHAATGCLLANVNSQHSNRSQQCAAGAAGSVAAKFVASQYDPQVDKLTAQGEATAAWVEKHVGIDATQMSQEELYAYMNTARLTPQEIYQWGSMKQAMKELGAIQAQSADLARLAAGLAAFVAKGSAEVINRTANQGTAITRSALIREMSPQYQRATALLAVLEHHNILLHARAHRFTVKEALDAGVHIPDAFKGVHYQNIPLTGADLELLQDIAIMDTLQNGTPEQVAELTKQYGASVVAKYKSTQGQIIHYDWGALAKRARDTDPYTAFKQAKKDISDKQYDTVQGITELRTLFDRKEENYIAYVPLIDSLRNFSSAPLTMVFGGVKYVGHLLKKNNIEQYKKIDLELEKTNFAKALQAKAKDLLKNGDGKTPLPHNRKAISQAFAPGTNLAKSPEFFNFTGKPSEVGKMVKKAETHVEWKEVNKSILVKDPEQYVKYIEKEFYKGEEPLHPIIKQRILDYLNTELKKGNGIATQAGAPGLHAEVRAANWYLNNTSATVEDITLATYKLYDKTGNPFPACQNCSGILKGFNIITD
ncbi:DUF637 domain-containing protein [Pseudoalteromonas sp. Of7M-16]|uniref:DUF637 domain-containing protein n=1 Tax=Pseudoalteromonas sp. Of7M-16 TaxID=2917756 RepID=UPI001EF6F810|nr:DUF637 domain-containing protein [Pseudoalteromonas sp. Of7M-16]MCG7546814.1 DUF637 domain-containing protein [Pseudoalteromonas sp. Of7M-16]